MTLLLLFNSQQIATPVVAPKPIISLRHPSTDDRSVAEESRALDRRQGVADRDEG